MVLHLEDCNSVDKMSSANWVEFDTADEAKAQGFRACDKCHPFKLLQDQPSGKGDTAHD
jgi:methylphosphotriester-DNA--protein-cysteine methyltransferase